TCSPSISTMRSAGSRAKYALLARSAVASDAASASSTSRACGETSTRTGADGTGATDGGETVARHAPRTTANAATQIAAPPPHRGLEAAAYGRSARRLPLVDALGRRNTRPLRYLEPVTRQESLERGEESDDVLAFARFAHEPDAPRPALQRA